MGFTSGRSASVLLGMLMGTASGVFAMACGNGDDLDPNAGTDLPERPVVVKPLEPATGTGDGADDPRDVANSEDPSAPSGDPAEDDTAGDVDPDRDPTACKTPKDVSGRPTTIAEAMILMNSLPRPTTLACFLQALERPLELYATSSGQSLQPSPGPRSPRTFIVNKPLVMSIVFEGKAAVALELGFRTTETRSVKTEILFPLTRDVTYANLFDEVMEGDTQTRCSACHIGEVRTVTPTLPMDVFESDIFLPYDRLVVDVESLRGERAICDAAVEPERCALLSALFDFGEVGTAPQGILF
jgi:hypothetical protein